MAFYSNSLDPDEAIGAFGDQCGANLPVPGAPPPGVSLDAKISPGPESPPSLLRRGGASERASAILAGRVKQKFELREHLADRDEAAEP
jgi:hypothetical protein